MILQSYYLIQKYIHAPMFLDCLGSPGLKIQITNMFYLIYMVENVQQMALPSYLSSNTNAIYKQINIWHTTQNSTYGTLVIPGSSLGYPLVIPWLSLGYP